MPKKTLPKVEKVQTIRSTRGEVIFHFDPTKVPSRKSNLTVRLNFAADYLERMLTGQPAAKSVVDLCLKWIREGA